MHQTQTRVMRYDVNLRQEQAHVPRFKEAPVDPGTGMPQGPPEQEMQADGTPVLDEVTIDMLAFRDQDSPDEWLFVADPAFRVELIKLCLFGLTDTQKQEVTAHLTGGIVPATAADLRGLPPMNRAARRREARLRK